MRHQQRLLIGFSLLACLWAGAAAWAVVATGGDMTNDAAGYHLHIFTNSGTFTVTVSGNVEVLLVAGGGGGFGPNAGGGGAGGGINIACASFCGTNGILRANGGDGGIGGLGFPYIGGGGGGGRIAVLVGIYGGIRNRCIAGTPVRAVITNWPESFVGSITATNGTGYTNSPPGGAAAGTIRFFQSLKGARFAVGN